MSENNSVIKDLIVYNVREIVFCQVVTVHVPEESKLGPFSLRKCSPSGAET